jgi:hypothetical protein
MGNSQDKSNFFWAILPFSLEVVLADVEKRVNQQKQENNVFP